MTTIQKEYKYLQKLFQVFNRRLTGNDKMLCSWAHSEEETLTWKHVNTILTYYFINAPGKIRRGDPDNYIAYVNVFWNRVQTILPEVDRNYMERPALLLTLKMIQENIYSKYHDVYKYYPIWKSQELLIPRHKVGCIIGPKGKHIKDLQSRYKCVELKTNINKKGDALIKIKSTLPKQVFDVKMLVNQYLSGRKDPGTSIFYVGAVLNLENPPVQLSWLYGIIFEIIVAKNCTSPITRDRLQLCHLTKIGDLITISGETFEVKTNINQAQRVLKKGRHTGVVYLQKNEESDKKGVYIYLQTSEATYTNHVEVKVEDFVNMFGEAKLLLSQHGTLGMDFPLKEFRNTINPFCTVEVDTFKEYMIQQFENL